MLLAAAAAVNVVPSVAVDPPPPIAAEPLTARSVFPDLIDMKLKRVSGLAFAYCGSGNAQPRRAFRNARPDTLTLMERSISALSSDTNKDKVPDTAFSTVIANAEAVRLNSSSTATELRAQRDLLEAING